MAGERDCEHCFHKVPIFDEEGYCTHAECEVWNCDFVSRKEVWEGYLASKNLKETLKRNRHNDDSNED